MPADDNIIENTQIQNNDEPQNLKAKVEAVLFVTARAMKPIEI